MPKSIINSKYEFDENVWVVSALNTGSKLTGHSVIVVEGIKKESNSIYQSSFIGQYDIKFTPYDIQSGSGFNTKGYVSRVDIFEGDKSTRDYSKYQAKSYLVDATKAKEMIKSIKDDQMKIKQLEVIAQKDQIDQIDSAFIKQHGFMEYQLAGKNSLLAEEGAGDNCAGWTLEKLSITGICDPSGKPAPEKVAGGCTII